MYFVFNLLAVILGANLEYVSIFHLCVQVYVELFSWILMLRLDLDCVVWSKPSFIPNNFILWFIRDNLFCGTNFRVQALFTCYLHRQ